MALLPIHDRNPRLNIGFPYVTVGLIAANLVVFVYQLGLGAKALSALNFGFGFVPVLLLGHDTLPPDFAQVPPIASLVSYQFLHGGWAHLLFNMVYLWIFGDNVEDAMGHLRFLLFYLICGVLAGLAHWASNPMSEMPMIGASGAISGVLGAYFILHPHVKIWTLLFWVIPLRLPALIVLGLFLGQNLFFALFEDAGSSGVALWAHIGGFAAGAALIAMFRFRHVKLWHKPPRPWK